LNLAFRKKDVNGVDGIDFNDAAAICLELGIGFSTDVEFINALTMTKPEHIKNKDLRGLPIVPRIVAVRSGKCVHCVVIRDKNELDKSYFEFRELENAYAAVARGNKMDQDVPIEQPKNSLAVKAPKRSRAAAKIAQAEEHRKLSIKDREAIKEKLST